MPGKKHVVVFVAAFSVILESLALTTPSLAASKEKVLYRFCSVNNCADGDEPLGGVISDRAGNLYGTTELGGIYDRVGAVFELIPNNGKWTEKVLHNFRADGKDGYEPHSTLIMDARGNLYGTTARGGASGNGTVFELMPNNGEWTYKLLHDFNDKYGSLPYGGLVLDASGNLYGTTYYGGANSKRCPNSGCGTVFELTLGENGKWTEKMLYAFSGHADGGFPFAGLILDTAGNLYGTTSEGGDDQFQYGCGVVFELTPNNSKWTYKVLHRFIGGNDGCNPWASLILDAAGNLYGTTPSGGDVLCNLPLCCGIVFELTPNNDKWTYKALHVFNGKDGSGSTGPLLLDTAGNLYGTAMVVFELIPNNAEWTEKVLYNFKGGKDGGDPGGALVLDAAGNLYGTTYSGGGNEEAGVVFEITP